MKKKKTPKGIKFISDRERAVFEIIHHLGGVPYDTLVRIGHNIKGHIWVDDLPGKPDGWDNMSLAQKNEWAVPIYDFIENSVGRKALWRYYHTTELGRTDVQFEDWWDSLIIDAKRGLL